MRNRKKLKVAGIVLAFMLGLLGWQYNAGQVWLQYEARYDADVCVSDHGPTDSSVEIAKTVLGPEYDETFYARDCAKIVTARPVLGFAPYYTLTGLTNSYMVGLALTFLDGIVLALVGLFLWLVFIFLRELIRQLRTNISDSWRTFSAWRAS
jgi:hypothetical protein